MISIIVAIAKNGVIGKGDDLPWKLSDDLKHFAKVTKGHTVIMGRKTYESIVKRLGHALPNRRNIVVTSQVDFKAPSCMVVRSVKEALSKLPLEDEAFVTGGGEIYRQFLPLANKLYITEVDVECDGDVFFPPYSKDGWKLISSEHHNKDEKNSYDFTFLELVRK
ncbi:MAG: dihydrofolate reductase [Candidatus Paceibacterota bacterium]|jgi:dihydrofolate reductase